MSGLQLKFEFRDPGGIRGEANRATLADLKILVNDRPVTQVNDRRAQSTRESICVPLYPLAEWIAVNWWALLYESETPGRSGELDYSRRHSFRFAGSGYAWPDLEIRPGGLLAMLDWKARDEPDKRVAFQNNGEAWVKTTDIVEELGRFVTTVLDRLATCGVSETFLEEEWSQRPGAPSEEQEFCQAAGSMGLDPFDLPEADAQAIVSAAQHLPSSLRDEFFLAAEPRELARLVEWVRLGLRVISENPLDLRALCRATPEARPSLSSAEPWRLGYECAKRLRASVGWADHQSLIRLYEELEEHLNRMRVLDPVRTFDALVQDGGRAGFYLNLNRECEEASRFTLARALFEFFFPDGPLPALVSAARTARQKANRAFAAELLAPAHLLNSKLKSAASIGEEQVDELAREFQVSSYVIRHQIENHRLARIVAT